MNQTFRKLNKFPSCCFPDILIEIKRLLLFINYKISNQCTENKKQGDNDNDLLLVDTAVLGLPQSHIIPEWFSILPPPSAESPEARMYLHLYDSDKAKKDFAVDMEFARMGIMTVRKLIGCGQIRSRRIKMIVSPMNVVRGVRSTCRVVAVEE